jgi:hypothetical protein
MSNETDIIAGGKTILDAIDVHQYSVFHREYLDKF